VENEDQTEAYYVCDFCGQKIEDPEENVICCPVCERIICPKCLEAHPLINVEVKRDGSESKRRQWMCSDCKHDWERRNPKQVGLDFFWGLLNGLGV
jgi:hypothetical protein